MEEDRATYAGAVEGHSRHREQQCRGPDLGIQLGSLMDLKRGWGGWDEESGRDHTKALGAMIRTLLLAGVRCRWGMAQPEGPDLPWGFIGSPWLHGGSKVCV